LQLGVAESLLLEDLLVPVMKDWTMMDAAVHADCIYYQPTAGRLGFRFLARTLKIRCLPKGRFVDGVVLERCSTVLENLCALADGDTVLIQHLLRRFEFDLARAKHSSRHHQTVPKEEDSAGPTSAAILRNSTTPTGRLWMLPTNVPRTRDTHLVFYCSVIHKIPSVSVTHRQPSRNALIGVASVKFT
jgi:hypothetical protein